MLARLGKAGAGVLPMRSGCPAAARSRRCRCPWCQRSSDRSPPLWRAAPLGAFLDRHRDSWARACMTWVPELRAADEELDRVSRGRTTGCGPNSTRRYTGGSIGSTRWSSTPPFRLRAIDRAGKGAARACWTAATPSCGGPERPTPIRPAFEREELLQDAWGHRGRPLRPGVGVAGVRRGRDGVRRGRPAGATNAVSG